MKNKIQENHRMNTNNVESKLMMILISVESRLKRNKGICRKLVMIIKVQLSTIGFQWMTRLMFIIPISLMQIEEIHKMLPLISRYQQECH